MKNERIFGALISCSRGPMNVGRIKDFIDKLSLMGYNYLELQVDTEYKIDGEPFFGYLNGAYTKEEIKEIDLYAKSKGIELSPCIQTLGHLSRLLSIPEYSRLADTSDVLLIDEPETYRLIEKMIKSISESFSSEYIHIGADEAFGVGLGRYLSLHGYKDRYDLLLRHVQKVVDIAKKYNLKPKMWSDMFSHLATEKDENGVAIIDKNVREKVPDGISLCCWDYAYKEDKIWDTQFKSHKDFNREIWFYGSSWTCWGYAPFNNYSIYAMRGALQRAKANGIDKIVITLWADSGHECSYFSALPALYTIRQNYLGNFDEDKIKQGFYDAFKVSYDDFMLLDLPNLNKNNEKYEKTDCVSRNILFNDCFLGKIDPMIEKVLPIPFGEYAEELFSAKTRMGEYGYIFDYLAKLCKVCEIKAELGIRVRKSYQNNDRKELTALLIDFRETAKRMEEFTNSFRKYWMKDYKTEITLKYHEVMLGGLTARVRCCAERIEKYLLGEIKEITELEETLNDDYGPWNTIWGWEF